LNKLFYLLLFFLVFTLDALAQNTIDAPEEKKLFESDTLKAEKAKKKEIESVLSTDAPRLEDLNVKAPNIQFNKEKNEIYGSGGLVMSQFGTQVQAEEGTVNLTSKETNVSGNVIISTPNTNISADSAQFNFNNETGSFVNAKGNLEKEGYVFEAEKAEKVSEFQYQFFDTAFTTCHCADGVKPWTVDTSEAKVTKEGYARCYSTTVKFHDVPVFYSPYFIFPVKSERASGLLAPTYGHSSKDGFQYKQPLFLVIDDSTDLTVSPFIETKSRYGSAFDYRQDFSRLNKANSRLIYSDENRRGSSLRGTLTDGVVDPTIDTHRFLGYYSQTVRSEQSAEMPYVLVSDIHYASDDLAVREFDDADIAEAGSRFLTSTMVARTSFNDYLSGSLGGEFNQYIDKDDDFGFQRLPELNLSGLKSFRPFGQNSYGARIVTRGQLNTTSFVRQEGYDGFRTDFSPNIGLPFHVQNYFSSELGVGSRQTIYNLRNEEVPGVAVLPTGELPTGEPLELDSSNSRQVYNIYFKTSTAVERVYELPENSVLDYLTNLGASNQGYKLKRVKNTIEPYFKYSLVPPTSQGSNPPVEENDLPFFDSLDRVRQKSVFLYGMRSSLYGRFMPLRGSEQAITELTPKINELPDLNSVASQDDLGTLGNFPGLSTSGTGRIGSTREIAAFTLQQTYDYVEDQKNLEPYVQSFSDIGTQLELYPTSDFGLSTFGNYKEQEGNFSSWGFATKIRDDRGDSLRAVYSYRERNFDGTGGISQIEGNAEAVLSERLRLGYYTRFDDLDSEFITNRFALRIKSACSCWHFDIGYSEKTNPDKEMVFASFTFSGLGEIKQGFGLQ
jgi:LPS-assembly protein